MLYNAYRPQKFTEVVGQTEVIENLMSQSIRDKFFGVYILCGQFGSGKTTTARIIAMAANCQHKDERGNPCGVCESCRSIKEGTAADVQEIAAAVSTGVDKVREICDTVSYLPVVLKKKVYIIDEVQALSKAAFQAFLKMLEEPPAHAVFILATTDVGAIPPTVRSRAATYYFRQLTQSEIAGHVRAVAESEGITVSEDACEVIAKYSQGSMRNALSLLDMAAQEQGAISGETVERLLGVSTPDAIFSIIESVLSGNAGEVVSKINSVAEGGADLSVLVSDMLNAVSDLTVAAVSLASVKGTEHYLSLIQKTVLLGSSTRFCAMAEELFYTKQKMSKSPEVSTLIVSLVRLSRNSEVVAYKDSPEEEVDRLRQMVIVLMDKVLALEERIGKGIVTEQVCIKAPVTVSSEPEAESANPVLIEKISADKSENIVPTKETLVVPEQTSISEEDEMSEDDFFSFLGLFDEPDEKNVNAESAAINNHRSLTKDALYSAVLSCCEVVEEGDTVTITSVFPVAERFLKAFLAAAGRRGCDVSGISIG